MKTVMNSSIQSPICLICACKFPYVSSRKENDINWRMPFEATSARDKRILRFMNQRRADVESMFGLETYLENYGCIQKNNVHLADDEYIHEFDDWLLTIPFADESADATFDVDIVCCPEDRKCSNVSCRATSKRVCHKCEVPICKDCEVNLIEPWDIFKGTVA